MQKGWVVSEENCAVAEASTNALVILLRLSIVVDVWRCALRNFQGNGDKRPRGGHLGLKGQGSCSLFATWTPHWQDRAACVPQPRANTYLYSAPR